MQYSYISRYVKVNLCNLKVTRIFLSAHFSVKMNGEDKSTSRLVCPGRSFPDPNNSISTNYNGGSHTNVLTSNPHRQHIGPSPLYFFTATIPVPIIGQQSANVQTAFKGPGPSHRRTPNHVMNQELKLLQSWSKSVSVTNSDNALTIVPLPLLTGSSYLLYLDSSPRLLHSYAC